MTKVETLEQEIGKLSPSDLAAFRQWFLAYDAQNWDDQIELDVKSGRLDDLGEKALAEHRQGKSQAL